MSRETGPSAENQGSKEIFDSPEYENYSTEIGASMGAFAEQDRLVAEAVAVHRKELDVNVKDGFIARAELDKIEAPRTAALNQRNEVGKQLLLLVKQGTAKGFVDEIPNEAAERELGYPMQRHDPKYREAGSWAAALALWKEELPKKHGLKYIAHEGTTSPTSESGKGYYLKVKKEG